MPSSKSSYLSKYLGKPSSSDFLTCSAKKKKKKGSANKKKEKNHFQPVHQGTDLKRGRVFGVKKEQFALGMGEAKNEQEHISSMPIKNTPQMGVEHFRASVPAAGDSSFTPLQRHDSASDQDDTECRVPRHDSDNSDQDDIPRPRSARHDSDTDEVERAPARRHDSDSDQDDIQRRAPRHDSDDSDDSDQDNIERPPFRHDSDTSDQESSSPKRKRQSSLPEQQKKSPTSRSDTIVVPAGLTSVEEIDMHSTKMRQQLNHDIRSMGDLTGRAAETVYRDRKTGRRITKEEYLDTKISDRQRKQQEREKQKQKIDQMFWGRGLVQLMNLTTLYEQKEHLTAEERGTALAFEDPMTNYGKGKKRKRSDQGERGTGSHQDEAHPLSRAFKIPFFRGHFPTNRFEIRPGFRWDGVDRSNGFERRFFSMLSEAETEEKEAYRFRSATM
uniref:BUD13 homolog n=1 Tax=Percolomonas cosmopolitus TaxID=63605 RepID=A0A7S1KU40_9EUKA